MAKKKTTLMIEESLYDAVRIEAIKSRKSISDVVAEAAREYLSRPEQVRKKVVLPSFKGAKISLPPNVDIRSTSQVLGYLDDLDRKAGLPPSQF